MGRVGVIGSGKFGLTVSNLLARNTDVLLFARNPLSTQEINNKHLFKGISLADNIEATSDIQKVCKECNVIYPIVPSANFREMMQSMSAYLQPDHFLIHATKGLDLVNVPEGELSNYQIGLQNVRTMSEVIREETSVVRIGCISGPNLSYEINKGLPAATVIASEFDEVIKVGESQLTSDQFFVFGSHDLKGTELAGSLKNIIAIGSGILGSMQMGHNVQALLLTRGLREMILIGKLMGSTNSAFLGTAGIGDLIATANSSESRNFKFGYRLAEGETADEIVESTQEIAEGVRTLKIAEQLVTKSDVNAPITKMLYRVVYEGFDIKRSIHLLMRYPFSQDVDFITT